MMIRFMMPQYRARFVVRIQQSNANAKMNRNITANGKIDNNLNEFLASSYFRLFSFQAFANRMLLIRSDQRRKEIFYWFIIHQ